MLQIKSMAQRSAVMRKVRQPKTLTNTELDFALKQFQNHVSTSARGNDQSIHKASLNTLNSLIKEKRSR